MSTQRKRNGWVLYVGVACVTAVALALLAWAFAATKVNVTLPVLPNEQVYEFNYATD